MRHRGTNNTPFTFLLFETSATPWNFFFQKCDNDDMNLLCQQIGLKVEGEERDATSYTIRSILMRLKSYSDNGPTEINGPGRLRTGIDAEGDPDYAIFFDTMQKLAEHKIIIFKFINQKYIGPNRGDIREFKVFVTNRYKLELLRAEIKALSNKHTYSLTVDNLLYYDVNSGEMFFNGTHKTLRKRNKKLLDVLFLASPNYVSRKTLLSIARSSKKYAEVPTKFVVTEAFTNLRKVCGVSGADAIKLNDDGWLNARVFPLDFQLPPSDFITD